MKKNEVLNQRLQEKYYRVEHPSGLTILLYPMPGFSSSYALFGTHYGSINTVFKTQKEDDFVTVPEGVAHFLEHKLFESEDGTDAFERFAKTGASANAYTSFDRTCYEFTCTERFEESLEVLLIFVQQPYFTEKTVQKEQGIIGQEIRMLQDRPGWKVLFNLLQALYINNPVRVDIGGTIESIAKIDAELLYRCYHTFYNMSNMVLAIAGNFDVDVALDVVRRCIKTGETVEIECKVPEEPFALNKKFIEEKQEVSVPLFNIGFKEQPLNGMDLIRASACRELLLELMTGEDTEFYRKEYDANLLNQTFSTELFTGPGYFVTIFDGESKDPQKLFGDLKEEIRSYKQNGFTKEQFQTAKKSLYGRYVRTFNNVESVASSLVSAHFSGVDVYDMIETIAALTYEDAEHCLENSFNDEFAAISIISPLK